MTSMSLCFSERSFKKCPYRGSAFQGGILRLITAALIALAHGRTLWQVRKTWVRSAQAGDNFGNAPVAIKMIGIGGLCPKQIRAVSARLCHLLRAKSKAGWIVLDRERSSPKEQPS